MTKLIFRRSDALIERSHPMVDDVEIIVSGDVQLTYATLRDVETSNPIAACIDGDWYIEQRFDGIDDRGPYSDIIILQGD